MKVGPYVLVRYVHTYLLCIITCSLRAYLRRVVRRGQGFLTRTNSNVRCFKNPDLLKDMRRIKSIVLKIITNIIYYEDQLEYRVHYNINLSKNKELSNFTLIKYFSP